MCLFLLTFTASCSSQPLPPAQAGLYALRLDVPALVRLDPGSGAVLAESALDPSAGCVPWSLDPAPGGPYAALELACPGGPLVLLLDLANGETRPLVETEDSRFLAWAAEGDSLYLRLDSLGTPRIVRAGVNGSLRELPIPGLTYQLSVSPDGKTIAYAFTEGIGYGSQLWLADADGQDPRRLLSEPAGIITFASWSPDGQRLAYILMPDSQVPFPNGELWLVNAGDGETRFVAAADAGHGYAFAWSPDGERIAFVGRDNPDDPQVSQSASALRSNIYLAGLDGTVEPITRFEAARVEAPRWSLEGNRLVFRAVSSDGTIHLWVHDLGRGEAVRLTDYPSCCPAWVGK
ncbi:MAG: DPP IV N-terminal domain-containing protein [Chloroflexota bacterium]